MNEVRVHGTEPVFASAALTDLAASPDAFSALVHQFAVAELVT